MTFKLIKLPQTYNFACPQAKKKKELFFLKQEGHFYVLLLVINIQTKEGNTNLDILKEKEQK